jgi:class 3 adenylate cyclase
MNTRSVVILLLTFVVETFSPLARILHADTQKNQTQVDSLQRLLMTAPPDSVRVQLLNALAWEFRGIQTLRALEYGRQAAKLAEELGITGEQIKAYNYIGVVYRNISNYPQAMSFYLKGLELAEKVHNEKEIAYSYNNIGNLYQIQKQYPLALENTFKALASFERLSDKRGAGYAHLRLGEVYEKQSMHEQAIEHYQESLRLRTELGDKEGLITPLNGLANIYRQMNQLSRSLENYTKSIAIERELGHKKGLASSLIGASRVFTAQGNAALALEYGQEALHAAEQASAMREVEDALNVLYEAYSKKGDFKNAFDWQTRYLHIKDSLDNDETNKQMSLLKTEYEAEKREAEIKMLNESQRMQTLWLNGLIGAILLLIGFTIVLIRFNRQRRAANKALRKQNVEVEHERQRSESLLLNVLPAAIALRIKNGETTIAETFNEATVLFADIVGFTLISSQSSAPDIVNLLDAIFSDFDALAEKYNLEKIKTIGDAYMVVGGVPSPSSDHVERVARFALEMMTEMQKYSDYTFEEQTSVLQIRVGIQTGSVVAGVIGKKKFSYDLWGDTVNTASRMESHGEAGKIHVSKQIFDTLFTMPVQRGETPRFIFEERGKISVKGKGEMETYYLTGTNIRKISG